MKYNMIKDIKTAAGIFKDMRKARKEGAEIKIHKSVQIPLMNSSTGFYAARFQTAARKSALLHRKHSKHFPVKKKGGFHMYRKTENL